LPARFHISDSGTFLMVRMLRLLALVSLGAFGLAACSSGGTTDPNGPVAAFTLVVAPSTITIDQGATGNVTITISRSGGFAGAVQVMAEGLPAGVTASPLTIAGGSTSGMLTLTAAAGAAVGGPSAVTIRATASGLDPRTANLALSVNQVTTPTPAFSLAVTPTTLSVEQGASGQTTVTIGRSGGFTGAVTLSATGLPTGVTVGFNPSAPTGTTSILTFQAGATAPQGNHSITVQGTGTGVAPQSTSVTLQVTVPAPPPPPPGGNVTFQFCGTAGGVPIWAAFRDGTGPWTRIEPNGAEAKFQIDSDRGGVAWVVPEPDGGTNLEVLYATRDELIGVGMERCDDRPGAGKTVTAAVSGVSGAGGLSAQFAFASLGGLSPFSAPIQGLDQITFNGVPDGPVDLIAARVSVNLGLLAFTTDRMILRRGLNPAPGSSLAPLDFAGGDSFAAQASGLTVTGVGGGESVVQVVLLRTANGFGPVAAAAGATSNWFGVPASQLQPGDLHVLGVTAASETALSPTRTTLRMIASPAPVTVALGPLLAEPAVTPINTSGHRRARVEYPIQAQYDRHWIADFSQGAGATAREAQVQVTRGYHGAGTGTVNIEVPDLSPVNGWNSDWGFAGGSQVTWTLSAAGWVQPGGTLLPPWQDGAEYLTASRMGAFNP